MRRRGRGGTVAADTTKVQGAPADSARARGLNSLLSGAAVVADPLAAGEQTVDAVRWLAKRRQFVLRGTPYGFTGLPIVYYSPGTGWNYGGRLQIADYHRRPYRYKLSLHWVKSTRGKRVSYLRFRLPHMAGTGFGLILTASNKRDIRARYYGLSNDSENNEGLTESDHPDFIDEDYYHYVLEAPRAIVNLLRHLYGPMTVSLGLGLERTDVDGRGQRSYYLDAGTPDGVVDGITGVRGPEPAVGHPGRPLDPAPGPVSGVELRDLPKLPPEPALRADRLPALHLHRRPLLPRLPAAEHRPSHHRGSPEGDRAPVRLRRDRRQPEDQGPRGSDTLRGFDRQRFTDNVRVLTNTEARYYLGSRTVFSSTSTCWPSSSPTAARWRLDSPISIPSTPT